MHESHNRITVEAPRVANDEDSSYKKYASVTSGLFFKVHVGMEQNGTLSRVMKREREMAHVRKGIDCKDRERPICGETDTSVVGFQGNGAFSVWSNPV